MLDLTTPLPEIVAAVDLGSNSFHLLVVRTGGGELTVVDRLREMVQLADGLDKRKRLTDKAQERALDCLRRFGERLRHMPPGSVRAVGTNTLRTARNAPEFIEAASEALGHPVETISGIEEARLVYLGVAQSFAERTERRLVVDIGGGSTELIIGEQFQPTRMESLYMGCVTMSRAYFPDGEISKSAMRAAELAARQELEPIRTAFLEAGWRLAVGASGTVRAAAAIIREAGWDADRINADDLGELRENLLEIGRADKLRLQGLTPRRRSVFPGGLAILLATFKALEIDRMEVSEGSLREGLLYDLVGRIRDEDVRSRSVSALADRCHVDWGQAGRVEHTAMRLLSGLAEGWQLQDREAGQLLGWAAQLHEIGLDVAHSHYHKHGAYIIEMADLPGFSRDEQKRLALLVRAHRRKFPAEEIGALGGRPRRQVLRLAIVLRLAALLHRSRSPDTLPDFEVTPDKRALALCFPTGWLEEHPLTRADLEHEAVYWKPTDHRLSFR